MHVHVLYQASGYLWGEQEGKDLKGGEITVDVNCNKLQTELK